MPMAVENTSRFPLRVTNDLLNMFAAVLILLDSPTNLVTLLLATTNACSIVEVVLANSLAILSALAFNAETTILEVSLPCAAIAFN
ncbi:hypothetical protein Xbed_03647 [Xenorhabdus beddingii]|uniref:Uncharacterized protein n=1 Tax=Xenorhabdus beddingii TaxID=40578 RepID=A0A1Y2S813_9GAMM|nr:hypothetical protein Xbed_03647 [Xenorhabdus beddingii]